MSKGLDYQSGLDREQMQVMRVIVELLKQNPNIKFTSAAFYRKFGKKKILERSLIGRGNLDKDCWTIMWRKLNRRPWRKDGIVLAEGTYTNPIYYYDPSLALGGKSAKVRYRSTPTQVPKEFVDEIVTTVGYEARLGVKKKKSVVRQEVANMFGYEDFNETGFGKLMASRGPDHPTVPFVSGRSYFEPVDPRPFSPPVSKKKSPKAPLLKMVPFLQAQPPGLNLSVRGIWRSW